MKFSKKNIITAILTLGSLFFISPLFAATSDNDVQEDEAGFYYTVKKGDTLWDLSKKFYNSKWIWPGLWQMNDQIKNPHWIYPGSKIRIFLTETQVTALKSSGNTAKKNAPDTPAPIPEPDILPSFSYPGMDSLGFIRKNAVPPHGQIIKSRNDTLMMSINDIVYIEPFKEHPLVPGQIHQIYSTKEIRRTQDKKNPFTGIKHQIKGILKIKEHKGSYATAQILQSFRDTKIGDSIMPYTKKAATIPVAQSLDGIDSKILCSEDNTNFINDNSIAFIDRGMRNGIQPGQLYTVFQQQPPVKSSIPKKSITIHPLETGKLIVLHTEEIASTVLILSSTKDIGPDDLVN